MSRKTLVKLQRFTGTGSITETLKYYLRVSVQRRSERQKMQMESTLRSFSLLVSASNIQYRETKKRDKERKKATEFQYRALPATVNES
jgi:hypothetical protein